MVVDVAYDTAAGKEHEHWHRRFVGTDASCIHVHVANHDEGMQRWHVRNGGTHVHNV